MDGWMDGYYMEHQPCDAHILNCALTLLCWTTITYGEMLLLINGCSVVLAT